MSSVSPGPVAGSRTDLAAYRTAKPLRPETLNPPQNGLLATPCYVKCGVKVMQL